MSSRLSPEIFQHLVKVLPIGEDSIRVRISEIRRDYPNATMNAAAHLLAQRYRKSILGKLSDEDKKTLPNVGMKQTAVRVAGRKTGPREKITEIVKYESTNYFIKGHIKELNRAYSKNCYTSVHILARKIIENLIREILVSKFPSKNQKNRKLYYDIDQKRFKDFTVILKNLYEKRHKFDPEKVEMIESLYAKAKRFKKDANKATHSWYALVEGRTAIDELNIQSMIELVKEIKA